MKKVLFLSFFVLSMLVASSAMAATWASTGYHITVYHSSYGWIGTTNITHTTTSGDTAYNYAVGLPLVNRYGITLTKAHMYTVNYPLQEDRGAWQHAGGNGWHICTSSTCNEGAFVNGNYYYYWAYMTPGSDKLKATANSQGTRINAGWGLVNYRQANEAFWKYQYFWSPVI